VFGQLLDDLSPLQLLPAGAEIDFSMRAKPTKIDVMPDQSKKE
jgi:hypothetical protein